MRDPASPMRCFGGGDPLYEAYHDHEWGVPARGERELFERVVLEGFQCGLSWNIVLRRRDGLRDAYAGFDPALLATWGDDDVERLMVDDRVFKNRQKVRSAITNARALLALHSDGRTLDDLVWTLRPARHDRPVTFAGVPSRSPEGDELARRLRRAGFTFVGPVTAHATLQAVGVVNDHLVGCPAGDAIDALG